METTLYYLLLLLGVYLEGETALLTASFLAEQKILDLPLVLLIAFIGTLLTDGFHFFLGRWQGKAFLSKRPKLQNQFYKISAYIERNPLWVCFGYRYIYGFRIVLPLALGMSRVSAFQFLLYSAISTLVWTLGFGLAGFYLGEFVKTLFQKVELYQKYFLLLASIIVFLIVLITYWFKKLKKTEV